MQHMRYFEDTYCIAAGFDGWQLDSPSDYSLIDILVELRNFTLTKLGVYWHQKEIDKLCGRFNEQFISNKIIMALNTITNFLLEETKTYSYTHRDALWMVYGCEIVRVDSIAKFLKTQYPSNQITTKLYGWTNGFESYLKNTITVVNSENGSTTASSLTTFILTQLRIDVGSNGRYFIIPASSSYPSYSLESVISEIKQLSLK